MNFKFDIELDFRLFQRWFFIKLLCKLIFILVIVLSNVKFMTIGRDGYEGYGEHKKKYRWLNRSLYNIIHVESRASKLLPEITMAIIEAESNGKRLAISPTGCIGYMQINPRYWHSHRPKELFQARMNVHYGTRIFAMYSRQTGNIIMALKKYERGNLKGLNIRYISKIIGNLIKVKGE